MTRCDLIAPLLPRVADGDAEPAEGARVGRHIEACTCCGILLARERRLSEAIKTIRDVEVDELFTATVMGRLPAKFHKRRRDRHGLRLAATGGLVALVAALGCGGDGVDESGPPPVTSVTYDAAEDWTRDIVSTSLDAR